MVVSVAKASAAGGHHMGATLNGVSRCPHCGIASPQMVRVWASTGPTPRHDGGTPKNWGTYLCTSCGAAVTVRSELFNGGFKIEALFPDAKVAHADIPETARNYLQQAFETLHAPDAATLMAASSVDGMLKSKGYKKGSLYERIDKALADNVLTKSMAKWAHAVRLEANEVRHADEENPHVTKEEAVQTVEFAEALGTFLFVLTAKIDEGIEAAEAATETATKATPPTAQQ